MLQVGIGTTRLPARVSGRFSVEPSPSSWWEWEKPVAGLGFAGQLWPNKGKREDEAPISEYLPRPVRGQLAADEWLVTPRDFRDAVEDR